MTSSNPRRKAPFFEPLAFEQLERRELMAGNVMASVQGSMLLLWGDNADNGVNLTYNAANKTYRVTGQEAGGSPTTINGLDTALAANVGEFGNVKQVAVYLNGGDDNFSLGSPQAVDTVIAKWFTVNTGDGNDAVTLGSAGNTTGTTAPRATSLRARATTVELGNGNDTLSLAQADIQHSMKIIAGEGDDDILFATEFTPTGATQPSLFPVRVRGHLNIQLAGGLDQLDMKNVVVDGDLRLTDFAGSADIDLHNMTVRQHLDIDTGNDADVIAIDLVHAERLSVDTNAAIDDVDVTKSRFRSMNIKLGGGRDTILIRNTTSTVATYLDGGPEDARLTLTANVLRSLLKRNFG